LALHSSSHSSPRSLFSPFGAAAGAALLLAFLGSPAALAQAQAPAAGWQACAALADGASRLACFDRWAAGQSPSPAATPQGAVPAVTASGQGLVPPAPTAAAPAQPAAMNGCQDKRHTTLTRFWELERAADCGTFELRGYRPIMADVALADFMNQSPDSPAPGHLVEGDGLYRKNEVRLQLSARVKVAADLFTRGDPALADSLWVAYTQQSYWQFFNRDISRPFRTTDYEPEIVYIHPLAAPLGGGWKLRYAGLGLSHQSNGRELPASRSWNRVYLSLAAELADRVDLQARIWHRLRDGQDDNPGITDYIGRGELVGFWRPDTLNTYQLTLRHAFKEDGHGSARLDYFRALGKGARQGYLNDLRLHVGLFSGYGDSLLDYNVKRNVLTVGLALVDW
jgi:phospholipase A1